jgi:adenosylcobyric acid synthase
MKNAARALMVLGTASDAGKSITVAALCRILRDHGLNVAPFKAQNMALNSFATREGHEIGRAQAMQAQAARIEPHVDMNPILLKPTSDVGSQVIVNGKVLGNYRGIDYYNLKPEMSVAARAAYQRLAARYEVIVLEGAGSPVEMNLKDRDLVNLKMAEIADAKCLLVTDIDRGGVFGSLVGTYSLLEPAERQRFFGFLINKFRGDFNLFSSGIDYLEDKLAQPCLGVIPYLHDHGIDDEDSVSLERRQAKPMGSGKDTLSVCVIAYPYLANFTDFTALEQQANVIVYYARRVEELEPADILILPGSKNTISDLMWLKRNGLKAGIERHVLLGKSLLGICGGFQMLGRLIRDPFRSESEVEAVNGLGILDAETCLQQEKITRQAMARLQENNELPKDLSGVEFSGYEIHLGETTLGENLQPLFHLRRVGETEWQHDGAIGHGGRVLGTYLHGIFDSTEGLNWLLNHWRGLSGKNGTTARICDPTAERERRYDALADHFRRHLKLELVHRALNL